MFEDELYDDAVLLTMEFGKGSTSILQRRLRIGFGRALGLLDEMERRGLIGRAEPPSFVRPILKSVQP